MSLAGHDHGPLVGLRRLGSPKPDLDLDYLQRLEAEHSLDLLLDSVSLLRGEWVLAASVGLGADDLKRTTRSQVEHHICLRVIAEGKIPGVVGSFGGLLRPNFKLDMALAVKLNRLVDLEVGLDRLRVQIQRDRTERARLRQVARVLGQLDLFGADRRRCQQD